MALAIAFEIADNTVAFELYAETVSTYTQAFKEFIDDRRHSRQNSRPYSYWVPLAEAWQKELENSGLSGVLKSRDFTLPEHVRGWSGRVA